ncbi:tetratricopeptide repeat protein [Flavobacterium sp.]|uniref:tetratricopeptide repeat protein n=1 Tax=Flavobacterium sp. TaxID=239 RepID=UPI0012065823|nr:tetratricopeptide repeat protein [Flavobacterium sp.]RZJ68945.1 MAG: tetratricopeptide repeat protein [Flavobacterium sp.]
MPHFLKQTTLFLLLLLSLGAYAQKKVLDSLETALKSHTKSDTTRVNLLNNIASRIFQTDANRALVLLKESESLSGQLNYAQGKAKSLFFTANAISEKNSDKLSWEPYYNEALTAYEKLNDKAGMSACYHNFGRLRFLIDDYEKAESNYKMAIELAEEARNAKRLSISLRGLGVLYSKLGQYEKAIDIYKKAVDLDEKSGNKTGIGNGMINLGTAYKRQAKFTLALEYFHKALEIKQQIGDQPGIASALSSIGGVYSLLKRQSDASEYFKKALVMFEKLNDKSEIASVRTNLSLIELSNGNFTEARQGFEAALAIFQNINQKSGVADVWANIGTLEMQTNNRDAALKAFEKAAKIDKELGADRELAYCYLKMGRVYFNGEDYEKALFYANESDALATKHNILDFRKDVSRLLSEIYYKQQQYKLAFEKQAVHDKLKDSVFSPQNIDKAAQIKYSYAYKSRENTLKNAVKSKDGQLQASQHQKLWWILGFASLAILLGIGYAIYKVRKLKMERKQILTEQKLRRSQMNPHFIFNSLQNVRGLIHNNQKDEAVDYLNQFSRLTRQILESSDENYTSLAEEIELLENYVSIQQLLYNRNFDFRLNVDDSIDTESIFLAPMLTQPFIENAIKHGLSGKKEGGILHIDFHLKGDKLFFEVSDNGSGFDATKTAQNHKSMAMDITRRRLEHYSKNASFAIKADNILDQYKNVIGAKVAFEIPYIYEN